MYVKLKLQTFNLSFFVSTGLAMDDILWFCGGESVKLIEGKCAQRTAPQPKGRGVCVPLRRNALQN
jgi:hypothetical protein